MSSNGVHYDDVPVPVTYDDRGWTPLHVAASRGDLARVRELLVLGMDPDVSASRPGPRGLAPLHLAAKGGHLDVIRELVDHGASLNQRVRRGLCGWTPIHYAARHRKRAAVRLLLTLGAVLMPDINDARFNPPPYYCPGLEWACEEQRRMSSSPREP